MSTTCVDNELSQGKSRTRNLENKMEVWINRLEAWI